MSRNFLLISVILIINVLVAGTIWWRSTLTGSNSGHQQPTISDESTPVPTTSLMQAELLILETPQPNEKITSPLIIKGQARGQWFFEATFPVVLTDWDGLIIAEGVATAEGIWMTEEFVPFTAELTFTVPEYGDRGSLILQKSNPSGLPENDDAVEVPVTFER